MRPSTRLYILERDGYSCVACGVTVASPITYKPWRQYSIQHRKARGMGGSNDPAVHAHENLIVLCGTGTTGCHGRAEREREWAREMGYAVAQWQNPADVPVYTFSFDWALPTEDGWAPASEGWF